jgi:hypothetical protein
MLNEYIFISISVANKMNIVNYAKDSDIIKENFQIIKTRSGHDILDVKFKIENKNDAECAKILSKIHDDMQSYDPLTLICESSAYYNKYLYPLANEFERKLRKLLYLATSMQDDDNSKNILQNLENMTLGEIFDTLFFDREFIEQVKKRVKGKEKFSKHEMQEFIGNTNENTLWKKLFQDSAGSILLKMYIQIRDYRNDIMHAHNINRENFDDAKVLFNDINSDLDSAIELQLTSIAKGTDIVNSDFNVTLSEALKQTTSSDVIEHFDYTSASLEQISENYLELSKDPEAHKVASKMQTQGIESTNDNDRPRRNPKSSLRIVPNVQNIIDNFIDNSK